MNDAARKRILYIVDDEEIQLGDHPNGKLDVAARQMSPADLGEVIRDLVTRLKKIPPDTERFGGPRWRHNRAISFLRTVHVDMRDHRRKSHDLSVAISTGKETCTCGQRHPYGANFYVSARYQGKTVLLGGPYRTHAEALSHVDECRRAVHDLGDPNAPWYGYGTVAMPHSHRTPGKFGK